MHHRAQTRKQRRDRHESSSTFFTSTRRGVARLHAPHMRFAQLYGVRPAATEKKCDDFASRWCPVLYTLRARHSVGFRTVKMSAEVVRGHARFRSAISDFPAGLVQVRASATYTKSRGVKTGERGFRFVVRRSNSTKWRACVVKWSPSSHSQCRCACATHLSHDDAHRDAPRANLYRVVFEFVDACMSFVSRSGSSPTPSASRCRASIVTGFQFLRLSCEIGARASRREISRFTRARCFRSGRAQP